ncbi:Tfp pilus assembly protein PilN [Alkalibaculum bacchi]|uniref:Tfp pilus assembly protein PilN n=1 Tax=Alkalibaculum bacchi TaxID=645887 RepID=A0A366I9S5_9FIRM|nr:PilN domain-containing protein [Alkalibaculum bacchi]RBP65284.1 Tfp pilus assembly protein PilN [Alkalibaculum bacchi]
MMDINLLPEEMLTNMALGRKKKVQIILVLFLTMGILYLALFALDYHLQNKILQIDEQIQSMGDVKGLKQEISIKSNEINLIKGMIHERNQSTTNFYELIKRLEGLVPMGVTFTSQRGENGNMIISGIASKEEGIAELAANLYQLEEAHNIRIRSAAYENQIRFEITFSYGSNGGEEFESK